MKAIPCEILSSPTVLVTNTITFEGTNYSKDILVLLGSDSGHSYLAEIQTIITIESNAWLVARLYNSAYNSHLGAYTVTETENYRVICPSSLRDYYPLPSYNISKAKVVVLKHFVDLYTEQYHS